MVHNSHNHSNLAFQCEIYPYGVVIFERHSRDRLSKSYRAFFFFFCVILGMFEADRQDLEVSKKMHCDAHGILFLTSEWDHRFRFRMLTSAWKAGPRFFFFFSLANYRPQILWIFKYSRTVNFLTSKPWKFSADFPICRVFWIFVEC